MSNDFEDRLRDALRPVDPDEAGLDGEFARRVMSRIESEPSRPSRPPVARFRWLPAALAASAVLGIFVIHEWQIRREQQGLEARRQLIEALRLTGEKLDLAYQAVNSGSQPEAGSGSGA